MNCKPHKTNGVQPLQPYDPQRAGKLHNLLTHAIDDFLSLHPHTSKNEVMMALEVTWDAYEKELYHRWLAE